MDTNRGKSSGAPDSAIRFIGVHSRFHELARLFPDCRQHLSLGGAPGESGVSLTESKSIKPVSGHLPGGDLTANEREWTRIGEKAAAFLQFCDSRLLAFIRGFMKWLAFFPTAASTSPLSLGGLGGAPGECGLNPTESG